MHNIPHMVGVGRVMIDVAMNGFGFFDSVCISEIFNLDIFGQPVVVPNKLGPHFCII
jgi:hypothetical protein